MRVLFWSEKYLPHVGGIEIFGDNLMSELRRRGHEFTVLTCKSHPELPAEDEVNGIPVRRLEFHPPLLEKNLKGIGVICRRLREIRQDFGPDLIHLNTTQPSIFYHLHTATKNDPPTFITVHSPPTFVAGPRSLFGRLLDSADWVSAVSGATLRAVHRAVPSTVSRSSVILNGLPFPDRGFQVPELEPLRLLCAGRLVPDKGFDTALRSLPLILENRPSASITIAGDGPERAPLESLALDLGIEDRVHFCGWIDRNEMAAFLENGSMVIVPSTWEEPFGLVALQGLQAGRPVIASSVGGLPEVVTHGETGLLVKKERPDLIAQAVRRLADNPKLFHQLAAKAREVARREFSIDRVADQYEAHYHRVLDLAETVAK